MKFINYPASISFFHAYRIFNDTICMVNALQMAPISSSIQVSILAIMKALLFMPFTVVLLCIPVELTVR